MPIYEYRCRSCRKRFSVLVGVVAGASGTVCPACGSEDADRLVSRFARLRSEDDAMESMLDPSRLGDIENDPKAMRRFVKDMSAELGEDMTDEFEAAMEEEMSGKSSTGDDPGDDSGDAAPATASAGGLDA